MASRFGSILKLMANRIQGLFMRKFFRSVRLCAVCLMGLALLFPLAAQSPVNQQAAEGTANIYNLDRNARIGGVQIHGPMDKAVASQAVKLIKSIRADVDELTVFLNSPGGDVLAAMELGEEVRNQWAWTAVDDDGECLGACIFVLAAGVRRTPAPKRVGLQRVNFDQSEFASLSPDRAKQRHGASAKRVEAYLARMGMPKKLFQEMMRQSPGKVLFLDAGRLRTLGLDGSDRAYEQWIRANDNQPPLQSD
jgi:hypothetical protein